MDMDIVLYANGGSGNHGCEAITRGTIELLGRTDNSYTLLSDDVSQDALYGLDKLAVLKEARADTSRDLLFFLAYARMKLFHDETPMDVLPYIAPIRAAAETTDVALSVGGDNYCYGGTALYAALNKTYHRAGVKTVLWGCSIEPAVVKQPKVRKDLQRYNLIVARESITYDAVRRIHENVVLAPDPAFSMVPVPCLQDDRFGDCDTIGINISPMIVSNETKPGITYENYRNLIGYILDSTEYRVALIPHVVWAHNDDRLVLTKLYREFSEVDRLILLDDHSAPELKSCIEKCRIFVGARTHATIAAYSSGVPTLTVGYSVKARGIARDLFGSEEHYVLPVQTLHDPHELTEAYCWLAARETEIREHLLKTLPVYENGSAKAVEALRNL